MKPRTLAVGLLGLIALAHAEPAPSAVEILNQGIARFDAGDFDGALRAFSEVQTLAPSHPNPYRWLGLTYARLGRCREAIASIETFLRMVPPSDARIAALSQERERCRRSLGRQDGAPSGEAAAGQVTRSSVVSSPVDLSNKPRESKSAARPKWLWTVLGTTAGAVVIGLATWGLVAATATDYAAAARSLSCRPESCSLFDGQGKP